MTKKWKLLRKKKVNLSFVSFIYQKNEKKRHLNLFIDIGKSKKKNDKEVLSKSRLYILYQKKMLHFEASGQELD